MKEIKERIYTAGLIVIGNEILSGRTEDKNISYVAISANFALTKIFKDSETVKEMLEKKLQYYQLNKLWKLI